MGTTTITLDQDRVAKINQETPLAVQQAQMYLIESDEDYEGSLPLAEEYGRRIDIIVALFEGTKEQPGPKTLAFQTHRSLSNLQNQMTKPYKDARDLIGSKRKAWRAFLAQWDEAIDINNRRDAEKKRQVEILAEQKRLAEEAAAREAERKRQADELAAKAKELKEAGDRTAAKVLQEQAANIATLAEQQKQEDAELAKTQIEEMQKAPMTYNMPQFAPGPTKQKGSTLKKPWTFRVLKPELFPVNLLLPADEKKLDPAEYPRVRKLVQALGANHGLPDGCIEAYQDDQESIRRK